MSLSLSPDGHRPAMAGDLGIEVIDTATLTCPARTSPSPRGPRRGRGLRRRGRGPPRAADQQTEERTPTRLRSGTLGGGPIPAQVNAELGSLREELATNRLAAERLSGLDRLITILVARGLQPGFVLEDTEAAIGRADEPELAEAFLTGPVRAFVTELEAPCVIAIQTACTGGETFAQLAAQMRLVEISASTKRPTIRAPY